MTFALIAALASATTVNAHPVALTVSPARVVLAAPAARTLQLSNAGMERVAVDVAWRSLSRPAPGRWLHIAPGHLELRSGANAHLTLRAGPGAAPGDHQLLVLVTAKPLTTSRVAVRLRLAVRVRIRAPGRLLHRVAVERLQLRRLERKRVLLVTVANRGNATEQLRRRLTVTLLRRGRVATRLRLTGLREVYPGTRAVVALPYRGGVRGLVTAVVRVRLDGSVRPVERRYRLRL